MTSTLTNTHLNEIKHNPLTMHKMDRYLSIRTQTCTLQSYIYEE